MVPSALMEALYLVRELFAGPEITLPFKSKIELWLGHNKLFDDEFILTILPACVHLLDKALTDELPVLRTIIPLLSNVVLELNAIPDPVFCNDVYIFYFKAQKMLDLF